MERCLGVVPSTGSVVVRETSVQGVTPRSPKSLEGHNSMNTYPNGASEEFIGIYAKSVQESWLESQEKLCDTIKGWCLHSGTMVTREG